jgi:hypothetical protein
VAIFAASSAELGNPFLQFRAPDTEVGAPGSTFLSARFAAARQTANERRFRARGMQSLNKQPLVGECFMQFGDVFWFEHLHIIPKVLSLGNVISTQDREYEVFNGFRNESRTVTVRTATGLDGITLDGEPTFSPVTVLGPKETVVVSATISPTGPVLIDATISYQFDNGRSVQLRITGSRVVVVSLEPEAAISESWEWLTDIIEASAGDEQRISARDVPRQSWTYTWVKEDRHAANLINQLWGWAENIFAVPVWTDYTVLTADAAAGATTLNVESTDERDFRATGGELALLWKDDDTTESVEVSAITSTTLSLARETAAAFEAGDLVIPLRLVRLPGNWDSRNSNTNVRTVTVRWQVLDNVEFSAALSPSPIFDGGVYRDLPVWDVDSDYLVTSGNYSEREDKDLRFPASDGTGRFSTFTAREFPRNVLSGIGMEAFGRTEFFRLRAFLHYLRGRQKAFWMSTTRDDFTVESTTSATSTEINVNIVGYTRLVANAPNGPRTRRNVEIVYADGSKDYRRVVSSQETAGVREVLTLDSGISQECSQANVARISYLVKRRLNTDRVVFEHEFYEGEVTVPRLSFADVYDGE